MSEKILITGVGGFIGSTMLKKYMENPKDDREIIGIYSSSSTILSPGVSPYNKEIHNYPSAELYDCDIRDKRRVNEIIWNYKPDIIYHLAAQSLPMVSIAAPAETMDINAIGTINIFEAICSVQYIDKSYNPMVVVACSSAEYGESMNDVSAMVHGRFGISESISLKPLHPYGVSKVAQDMLARYYYTQYGIRCIRARIFNTTGPGKSNDVCSDLISRAIKIKYSEVPSKLSVGNLDSRRAILDVRDTISALEGLAYKGIAGEVYNISAHSAVSVREIIDIIENIARMKFDIEVDPIYIRPNDEPIIIGDTSKIEDVIRWEPTISIQETLENMYKYCDDLVHKQ